MPEEIFAALKSKAQEAKRVLNQVTKKNYRVHAIKKNELIFFSPEGGKVRLTIAPGLQEGTHSLSTGHVTPDGEEVQDGFLQRDVAYQELLRLLTNPMIWSWTYRSFHRRFSLLNGLIRLAYTQKEAWPALRPLIERIQEDLGA